MGVKVKIKIIVALILASILIIYFWPERKIFTIKNIKNEPSVLFEDTCNYNSFYIEDKDGNELSSIEYSNIPGEGKVYKINTYITINKLMRVKLEQNRIYTLSAITECAEYPIYRKYITFKISNKNIKITNRN